MEMLPQLLWKRKWTKSRPDTRSCNCPQILSYDSTKCNLLWRAIHRSIYWCHHWRTTNTLWHKIWQCNQSRPVITSSICSVVSINIQTWLLYCFFLVPRWSSVLGVYTNCWTVKLDELTYVSLDWHLIFITIVPECQLHPSYDSQLVTPTLLRAITWFSHVMFRSDLGRFPSRARQSQLTPALC